MMLMMKKNLTCTKCQSMTWIGKTGLSVQWFNSLDFNLHKQGVQELVLQTIGELTATGLLLQTITDYCLRNRFNQHQKFFYINAVQPEDVGETGVLLDKFHKVQPVIEKYRGLFRTNWRPEHFLAVDKSIIPYKGKFCPCRIYMPEKYWHQSL